MKNVRKVIVFRFFNYIVKLLQHFFSQVSIEIWKARLHSHYFTSLQIRNLIGEFWNIFLNRKKSPIISSVIINNPFVIDYTRKPSLNQNPWNI